MNTPNLNGIRVHRSKETIFVPLPLALQRACDGGCACSWCKLHPEFEPAWDTLAVSRDATTRDHTWLVHYPELNHEHIRRNEPTRDDLCPRSPEEIEAITDAILDG
jgi:hypothetical protein